MSLRSIILKFLRHVEKLESQSVEGDMYDKEFQKLKSITDEFRSSPQYSSSVGEQDVNRRKNRYKDILPYDNNRVILSEIPGVPGSDYINASFIKGASGSTAYIASQAPLPHTVNDFWRMIWECEVQVIIMACDDIESGRRKCEKYWPDAGEKKEFGDISVNLVKQLDLCSGFNAKKLSVSRGNVTKSIHHCHYHNWPDHGIPVSVTALLEMVKVAREFQGSETIPLLVHCSAGCGRTGTICAVDYVGGLLRNGKLSEEFSLQLLILEMRKQRIAMVQTKDQYVLVHKAVRELFMEHLKIIDSHPYENVNFAGIPVALKTSHDYENLPLDAVLKESDEGRNEVTEETGLKSQPVHKQIEVEMLNCRRGSMSKNGTSSSDGHSSTADVAPPLPIKMKIGHVARDNSNSGENMINAPRGIAPRVNQRSKNNSKMDYVNDWCEGISKSQTEAVAGMDIIKPSSGLLQAEPSPELRRSKSHLKSEANGAPGKPKIVTVVRKPSIAKLKALFENDVNTDSSGPQSSDSCSTDVSGSKRKPNSKDSSESYIGTKISDTEPASLAPPSRSKHKNKSKTIYISKAEYEDIIKRYEDTSFRIFKELKLNNAEDLQSSYTELLRCSPSLSTPSEDHVMHQDVDSNCSSPYEVRRRSRSTSHSPSSAMTDNISSKSDSVALHAKELMGRLVGSKRNSFAEKRNSTWYDDAYVLEEDLAQQERASSRYQNKVPLYLNDLEKDRQTEVKKPSGAVKRSISMKVGFRSPLIRRKNIRGDKVAAYLAVEDNGKSHQIPSHDRTSSQLTQESSRTAVGESSPKTVDDANHKAPKKQGKRLHGHPNMKPVQNPTFFTLTGSPVELTKFVPHDDDKDSVELLHDRNKKMYAKSPPQMLNLKDNRQSSPDRLPNVSYGSPMVNRKLKHVKENRPPSSKNLNIMKSSLPNIKMDSDVDRIGKTCVSEEALEVDSLLAKNTLGSSLDADSRRWNHDESLGNGVQQASAVSIRKPISVGNLASTVQEGGNINTAADQLVSDTSLQGAQGSKDQPMGRHTHRQDALNGNSYGAEMDEYCQKIIHDCQEYLVNHQYSNLTLEAKSNLFWIENTLQQSPRRAIVDVMSLSQESLKDSKHESDKRTKGVDIIPNYERLWFSHTGAVTQSPSKPKSDTDSTSVEEVSVVFSPNEEEVDEVGDDRYKMDRFTDDLLDKAPRDYSAMITYPTSASGDHKVAVPVPAGRTPKDAKFSKTVTELKSLIEELEVGMPSKPRKPQPAPRTMLASHERSSSPGSYPKISNTAEMNSGVIQMNSSVFRNTNFNDAPSNHDSDKNYFLDTDRRMDDAYHVERASMLQPSRTTSKEKTNHEYEEIIFKDSSSCAQPEDHIYEKLCIHSEFSDDLFGQFDSTDRHSQHHIPNDQFHHQTKDVDQLCSASKLYGQVHKPKRKKRHNGVKDGLVDEDMVGHHPDAFNHKSGKCNDHDYESLHVTTSWKDLSESLSRPVAPPRLRRNPSTSDKSFQDLYIRRNSTDATMVTKLDQENSDEPKAVAKKKWESKSSQLESDDSGRGVQDDNEDLPPVPVKTKDAYRLPTGVILGNHQNASFSIDAVSHQGKVAAKSLNKFHTNIFSKLISRGDKDCDPSTVGSGSSMSSRQEAQKPTCTAEMGFPRRLDKKPKGPRDPPAHWEVKA